MGWMGETVETGPMYDWIRIEPCEGSPTNRSEWTQKCFSYWFSILKRYKIFIAGQAVLITGNRCKVAGLYKRLGMGDKEQNKTW